MMTNPALSPRFVVGGLRFFAASFLAGLLLLLVAPLDVIRAFCALALVCSAAGFALHVAALGEIDPAALPAFRSRLRHAMLAAQAAAGDVLRAAKAKTGTAGAATSPPGRIDIVD
jgi:hypothetical protein